MLDPIEAQGALSREPPTMSVEDRLVKESYFPTQIYFVDVAGGHVLNATLKPLVYACRDADPDGIVRSNARASGAWHSSAHLDSNPDFAALTSLIKHTVKRIFVDLGYDSSYVPDITGLWANINPRYAYNRTHTHGNALWSGVYYVQAPPGCGRIYFRDPRAQAQVILPSLAEGPRLRELWTEVFYEAIEGRMIVFPAWLQHDVEANLTTIDPPGGDRISFSFNIRQRSAKPSPEVAAR